MPKSNYILCAHDLTEDKQTNLLTIYKIVEKVIIKKIPEGGKPIPIRDLDPDEQMALSLKVVAVWMRDAGDDDVEFEHRFVLEWDDKSEPTPIQPFTFQAGKELHRFIMTLRGFVVPENSDEISICSQVRRGESEEWLTQKYKLKVQVVELTKADK